MLSLLGKLQQNTRDLAPPELMQLGHDRASVKYTASAGEDVKLLPLLQHLLMTVLCPPSSWPWCYGSSVLHRLLSRMTLGEPHWEAVSQLWRDGAGSWCGVLPQDIVFPELEPWQHLRFFRCETLV